MEGLGISTLSSSSKGTKRFNGNAKLKGKQQVEPPTTYTVSKIDAGQAVLISDQIHCIEFPSILLPPGCTTGSVVSISCTRNHKEEQKRNDDFWDLQDEILSEFGEASPAPPRLRLRNVTQTSVTLEWDRLELATSKLLSLTIWRNSQRLAAIPNPLNNTSTKVSGLDVDAPYTFHLIMRTTAGTYASQTIKTRTLTLADTSGIAVCFGTVTPPELLEEAKEALTHMRVRWSSKIQIETTHFVCTHPAGPAPAITPPSESPSEAPDPGAEYQRASQLSIPIVQPAWVMACLREKRMVPISAYTLDKAIISGGPSSSASLAKNASARSSGHPAQQPREGTRGPIQLQNPPPPKNASPEVSTAARLPEVELQTTEDIQAAAPSLQDTALESVEGAADEVPSATSDKASPVLPEETPSAVETLPSAAQDAEVPEVEQEVGSPEVEQVAKASALETDAEAVNAGDVNAGTTDTIERTETSPAIGASVEEPQTETSLQQADGINNVNEAVAAEQEEQGSEPVATSIELPDVAESFTSASEESQHNEVVAEIAEETPVMEDKEGTATAYPESEETLKEAVDDSQISQPDTAKGRESLEEVKL